MLESIKIDHCSIVHRFDSLGKKTMEQNTQMEKQKLLEILLNKKRNKLFRKAFARWQVRTNPSFIKNTIR